MNCNYLNTSRSNPQFYNFSQVFEKESISNPLSGLDPLWKDQAQQAAWVDFWEREGHEYLEKKWHKKHPQYKKEIDSVTDEQRTVWQKLWEEHANDQSAYFWHIFSCVLENYENDLYNGLELYSQTSNDVEERLAHLELNNRGRRASSLENSDDDDDNDDEQYNTANGNSDFLDEEQQLKVLGLPTSFGVQVAKQKRKPAVYVSSESDSEVETYLLNMSNAKEDMLHDVKMGLIKKKKRQQESRIPEFMREENLLLKYWYKRFSLFSRFDHGILLDRESWFSVTPEKIAKQTARRLACDIIVDAFCGCGGNAIQFANTCGQVIAIDIDASKLAMAKQNAAIYGVSHKINFINADFLQFAKTTRLQPDVVFLSPPWGGPEYQKQPTFDIEQNLLPLGATQLMQHVRRLTENVGFFLPRNSNIKQVIALTNVGQQCEVEHNYLDTRLVAITAYYGDKLVRKPKPKPQQEPEA